MYVYTYKYIYVYTNIFMTSSGNNLNRTYVYDNNHYLHWYILHICIHIQIVYTHICVNKYTYIRTYNYKCLHLYIRIYITYIYIYIHKYTSISGVMGSNPGMGKVGNLNTYCSSVNLMMMKMMFTYKNYKRGVLKNLYHKFPNRPAKKA
jgi:hypothetical protein